jgi:hypothetical protein
MTDAIERLADRVGGQHGGRLEAVVAVEQARAVAQVAAQVQVAQQFPRDLSRVRAELDEATDQYELAAIAFYSLPNRGQGMTVHVARELAVIWGNVDYGVHELRRDDTAGHSEIQAFCWDMQRNSRNTRTFQVPHAITITDRRTKVQSRRAIVDLDDVYRNNQSNGARAMRECVFATLPRWLVDRTEKRLRETLRRGPGVSIADRVDEALGWAKRVRVTREQLEQRVGKPVARWDTEDLASLEVVAASINRGETTVSEQFDPATARVTVDELGPHDSGYHGQKAAERERAGDDSPTEPAEPSHPTAPEPVGSQRRASQRSLGKLIGLLSDLGIESDEDQRVWLSTELRRDVTTRAELTQAEVNTTIPVVELLIEAQGPMPGADQ